MLALQAEVMVKVPIHKEDLYHLSADIRQQGVALFRAIDFDKNQMLEKEVRELSVSCLS